MEAILSDIKTKLGDLQQEILTSLGYNLDDNLSYLELVKLIFALEGEVKGQQQEMLLMQQSHQEQLLQLQRQQFQTQHPFRLFSDTQPGRDPQLVSPGLQLSDFQQPEKLGQSAMDDSSLSDLDDLQKLQQHQKVLEEYRNSVDQLKKQNALIKKLVSVQTQQQQQPPAKSSEQSNACVQKQVPHPQASQFETAKFKSDDQEIVKSVEKWLAQQSKKKATQSHELLRNLERQMDEQPESQSIAKVKQQLSQKFKKRKIKQQLKTSDKKQNKLAQEISNLDQEIYNITNHIQNLVNEDESADG